jgi:TP901 family phage tail tape measure protein
VALRTIGVRLRLEAREYIAGVKGAKGETDKLGESLGKTGTKGKADLDALATTAAVAGAAMVGFAGAAVFAAARFDKQMSEVKAVSGATADEMDRLRTAAIDAGQATAFSATEAAQAQAELAKAGISTADILGGALSGSLSLASAGSLDLAQSAEIAAAAMNTFGLGGSDVGHIADVLAAAANKSAAGVGDLGQGLQQVGLVANQVGLSLEETVGLLAAFADRGLRGSDGATSLKTALQRLAAPTGKAKELMEELGISMYDATGQTVSAAEMAGQLRGAFQDLAPAQRNAALQTIFGSDAIRAANVLYGEGREGIQGYVDAVDDQGAASDVARTKMDNLAGDVEELTGSLETLAITGGSGATGGLRLLTQAVTSMINGFASLPPAVSGTVTVLTGLAGSALLAASAGAKIRERLAEVTENLTLMGPAGARAGRALDAAARFAGRAALTFTALQLAGMAVSKLFSEELNPQSDQLADSLAHFGATGQAAGEASRLLGKDLEDLNYDLQTLSSSGLSKAAKTFAEAMESIGGEGPGSQSIGKATERIAAYDAALTQLVTSGRGQEAAAVFQRMWVEAQKTGISLEDLQAGFPSYIQAAADASDPTSQLAKESKALGEMQEFAVETGQNLVELWDEMNGVALDADKALLAAKDAISEVSDAFEEGSKSVKGNSRAALENRIALQEASRKAAEAAQAYLLQGGTAAGAAKIMDDFRREAVKASGATGKAKDEVNKLANSLFNLPKTTNVRVNIRAITYEEVIQQKNRRDGGITERRHGGITASPAQEGLLREAQMFRGDRTLYAFAEPETGGEAFVPKRGDRSRSLGILQQAAGWYGAQVVPQGGGWYGGGETSVKVYIGDQELRGMVRTEVSESNRAVRRRVGSGMR